MSCTPPYIFTQPTLGKTPSVGSSLTVETHTHDLANQFNWVTPVRRELVWQTVHIVDIQLTAVKFADILAFISMYKSYLGKPLSFLNEFGQTMVGIITSDVVCDPINNSDPNAPAGCGDGNDVLYNVAFTFERTDI